MMTNSAISRLLTDVATLLSSGVKDKAEFAKAAAAKAEAIAQSSPGTRAVDLLEKLPVSWRQAPEAASTRQRARSYLDAVRRDARVLSQTDALLAAIKGDSSIAVAASRSAEALAQLRARPVSAVELTDPNTVWQELTRTFADPAFGTLLGSEPPGPSLDSIALAVSEALSPVRAHVPPPALYFESPPLVDVVELARYIATLAYVRASITEENVCEALDLRMLSDAPLSPEDVFPIVAVPKDDKLIVGCRVNLAPLYGDGMQAGSAARERTATVLRERHDEIKRLVDQGVPLAIAADPQRVEQSLFLRTLAGRPAKVTA